MKAALKKQFIQNNSTSTLPSYFKANGIGVSLDMTSLDPKGKLQQPKTSLLYDQSKITFDGNLKDSIISESPTEINGLSMTYKPISDKLVVKSTSATESLTIGDWFGKFIDKSELINKQELVANVMNSMYGTIDADSDKTVEQLYQEQQMSQIIDNLGNDDESLSLSQEELDNSMKKAQDLKNGVIIYDLGCGMYEVSLNMEDMSMLVNNVVSSSDPNAVGNSISNAFSGSVSTNSSIETTDENKEAMKDGFLKKLLDIVKRILVESLTTSPLVRVLMGIFSAIQNNGVTLITKPIDDFKNFKSLIKCLTDEMKKEISKFIFNLILTYLMALLAPVIKEIIKEKINNYLTVLKSLVGISS
jgi:dihydroxyacetone kinase DhaKLM complex PTS-EIIA-like component DhaM